MTDVPSTEIVLEVLEGCGSFAAAEASRIGELLVQEPTELRIRTPDLAAVCALRGSVAASIAITEPARRPREMLATPVRSRLQQAVEEIRRQRPRPRFHGVRLEAAGAGSPDMRRIADMLSEVSDLPVDDEDGDLVVRLRRGRGDPAGWEALVRTTARPLSARPWRVVDYPGAVNATIAASVLDRMDIAAQDSVLDMTCGSGTFLVEQLHVAAPRRAVGVDISPEAVDAARAHQRAARRRGRIEWITGDVLSVPLEGGFTRLLTNPPWGMLHGSHEDNARLLTDLLARAAELAAPGARLGVLTQEIRRMHEILDTAAHGWRPMGEQRFFQKGHHPRLFLLER